MSMITEMTSMTKDEATTWFNDLVEDDTVEIELSFTTKRELADIEEKNTEYKRNGGGKRVPVLNKSLYFKALAERIIKNWRGLKWKHLLELGLIPEGVNLEDYIEFSVEEAAGLLAASAIFEEYIVVRLNETSEFIKEERNSVIKKSKSSQGSSTPAQKP